MSKKILVLTSSPRKNSNTGKMADAFSQGAIESGHEVFRFDAGLKNIGPCHACNKCWSTGTACIYQDDFQELSKLLESCDVILFSTPLYWLSFPAQVKGAIDRFYAYGGTGGDRPMTIRESYLFVCGELPGDNEEYEPIIKTYKIYVDFLGWQDRGMIITGGHDRSAGIESSDILDRARELGKKV